MYCAILRKDNGRLYIAWGHNGRHASINPEYVQPRPIVKKPRPRGAFEFYFLPGYEIFLDILFINRNIAIDMGATKTDLFTKKQNELANMARALAHPARIAILQYLLKTNTCVCGSLVEVLGLAQPTISQHLKELKNAGLIQGTVEGTSICYCINPKVWNEYRQIFSGFFGVDPGANKCC